MGTEVETKMADHTAKEFWGGEQRGVCLQITAISAPVSPVPGKPYYYEEGFIQLTMEEAAALCSALRTFVKNEAVRRQTLLRQEIDRAKIAERTVFHEVAGLPSDLMVGPELAVRMVSRFCPKVAPEQEAQS